MSLKDGTFLESIRKTELPESWCWATIADLGEVRLGRQRSPKNRSDKYPTKYIRAANITWNGLDLTDVLDMEFQPAERDTYRLKRGDVVLAEASGSPDEVGKPAIWNDEISDCCFQNTVIRFRPAVPTPQFANYLFGYYARNGEFTRTGKGVGIHHLSAARFARLPFPVAPLNEQRRIVAKIEELFSDLDAGVAALERAKANLKRYRAAVLKAAVEGKLTERWRAENPPTEPADQLLKRILEERRKKWEEQQLLSFEAKGKKPPKNWRDKYKNPTAPDNTNLPPLPIGWCWATIEQLADVGTGTTPRRGTSRYYEGGSVPWVTSSAVNEPFVYEGTEYVTDAALAETTLELYPVHTLIIALYGEGKTRGKVSELLIEATINQALGALVMIDTCADVRPYLKTYLDANYIQLRRKAAGGMQPNLNLGLVKATTVALPPFDEQVAIVAEVERRLSVTNATDAQAATNVRRATRLRQSILKRAFEGKLVSQDPGDESARELLTRIQTERAGAAANGKPTKVRTTGKTRKRAEK